MILKYHNYFISIIYFLSLPFIVHSQTYTPGVSVLDATGYVEYIPGDLPVIISVPHGGYLEPDGIPDRDCDIYSCTRDAYTQELSRSVAESMYEETGCYPHVIINLLHRKKFDANREILEAADGNPTVEQSWNAYHNFIEDAKSQIVADYGRGLFLDIHGHGHEIQRLELGYRLTKSELQLTDVQLNDPNLIDESSIKTLVSDNLPSHSHAELLRGNNSFGTLLVNKGIPAVPSSSDPFPLDDESYFSGGYNTGRHGSENGGDIDGIQLECHQDIRFVTDVREDFADSMVLIINEYIDLHYLANYENNYCNLITDIHNITPQKNIGIYPNPASEQINIKTDLENINVNIYNCLGQNIFSSKWEGTSFDIQDLDSGFYFIEFIKDNEVVGTEKMIKH